MTDLRTALWSDDDIEIRDDGFLLLKDAMKYDDQPCLLQSTEYLLTLLYPGMTKETILQQIYSRKNAKVHE